MNTLVIIAAFLAIANASVIRDAGLIAESPISRTSIIGPSGEIHKEEALAARVGTPLVQETIVEQPLIKTIAAPLIHETPLIAKTIAAPLVESSLVAKNIATPLVHEIPLIAKSFTTPLVQETPLLTKTIATPLIQESPLVRTVATPILSQSLVHNNPLIGRTLPSNILDGSLVTSPFVGVTSLGYTDGLYGKSLVSPYLGYGNYGLW